MNFLSLRQLTLVSLSLTAFVFVEGCGGKKKVDDELLALEASQAITVSQNFPSLIGNGGEFATSVAVSGNLAVVGAPSDTNPAGKYTGAAYLLERQANQTWIVKQKLHPPASMAGGEINQRFGASVAIDGETVFVGAPLHPQDGQPAGLVHVFKRETQEGTYWTEETTLGLPELLAQSQWSVSGLGAAPGVQWRQMGPLTVKSGESWTVTMNGTNDADLHTRKGSAPGYTAGSFDCQPNSGSSNEACPLVGAGDHFIGVRGYDAYSKVTVQATLPTLNIAVNQDAVYGPFTVKDGQRLRAQITGTGDPDLVIRPALGTTTTPSSITALFVVGDSNLNAADIAIRDRIGSLGYQVQVVDDDVATTADATGKQVVVVSESTASAKIADKYKSVTVPVVALEVAIWDDLGMTGGGWQQDFGDAPGVATLTVGSNVHPMAAQLSGDVLVATAVTSKMVWGRPGTSAQIAATIPGDTTKAALFGYAAGAAMKSGTAPARRVGVFAGDPTAQSFTTSGGRLFDAAIVWATRRADALLVVAAVPLANSDEQLRLRMTEQGLSTHVITGPNVQLADTTGKAVVVISESTLSATVDNRLTTSTTPIVSLEPGLFDELGLTGSTWHTDMGDVSGQTDVVITNPSHPLAAGLSGTVPFATAPSKLIWGVPAATAINIARISAQNPLSTVPAANALAIFAYEKDAAMVGRTAPARRVAWAAGDGTALAISLQGWRLFASALSWASNIPTDCAGNPQSAGCSGATSGTEGPDLAATAACTSASTSATEMCVTPNPGNYYVTVRGFTAATYKLQVFFEPGHDNIALGGSYSMIGSDLSAKSDVIAIAGRNALGGGAGYAHVLRKKQGNWKFELSQADPSHHTVGNFAESIAVTANRLLVGAVGGRGRVLSFDYNGTSWSTIPNRVWESDDVSGVDGMGTAVAVDGDRIAFGLPGGAGGKGQVKIADWAEDRWDERVILNPQGTASASFGSSVALYQGQVAVGAPTGTNPGTAYLFANAGSNQPTVYSPSNAAVWADVGSTVALGPLSLLVGSPHDGVDYKGVVYTIAPLQNACATQPNGTPCEDGNACSTGDTCQSGSCVSGTGMLVCNDGNSCTADSCTPSLGCVYDTKAPEQQQLACNITGCGAGTCKAGACEGSSDSNAMCKLSPQVTCVAALNGGGLRAVFGYTNETKPGLNLSIPIGSNSQSDFKRNVVSGGVPTNQPTWIQAGNTPVAFTVDIPSGGQPVTWALGNKTATAQPVVDGRCNQGHGPEGTVILVGGESYLITPNAEEITTNAIRPTEGALGPLAGQGDVNPDGSYSYNIPIWVPPGTNGMQPSLSLSYNSRGGNGLLGVGWSLGGFSQITRCPKTMRVSGTVAPVTYFGEDQFCLDGNPLVKVADKKYRTKMETFSKIVQVGSGLEMIWKVFSKDGRIMTFMPDGVTRRFKTGGAQGALSSEFVPGWWLSSIADRFGNSIDYKYSNGVGPDEAETAWTIERYPTSIQYNGPDHSREVTLKYVDRPEHDVQESYVSGIRYLTTKLLNAVELRVKNESGLWVSVKEYRLLYHDNATNGLKDWSDTSGRKSITGRSLLKSVSECDQTGDSARCAPPTSFDWEAGSWDFERKELDLGPLKGQSLLSLSDVDEDGRPDLIMGELTERNLCPSENGIPPITTVGMSGFRNFCKVPRVDGGFRHFSGPPDICENKLEEHGGTWEQGAGGALNGTELCDVYDHCQAPYDQYFINQSTGHCDPGDSIHRTDAKWVKYTYLLNKSSLHGGDINLAFGAETPLVDRYFQTDADKASAIRSPVITNLDLEGNVEVLVTEREAVLEYPHLNYAGLYSYHLERWPLGATTNDQMQLVETVTHDPHTDNPTKVLEPGPPSSVAVGDYNSDGLPDLLFPTGSSTNAGGGWLWAVHLGGGSEVLFPKTLKSGSLPGSKGRPEEGTFLDLDGDGKSQLVTWFNENDSASNFPPNGFTTTMNRSPTFIDFNGDGLVDALNRANLDAAVEDRGASLVANTGIRGIVKMRLGSGHPAYYLEPYAANVDDGVRTGDLDMDGKNDVFLFGGDWRAGNWTPTVLLRKGNTTRTVNLAARSPANGGVSWTAIETKEAPDPNVGGIIGWRQAHVVDFDGDGLMDIVQVDRSTGKPALYRRKGSKPDMLKSVSRGISNLPSVKLEYASVSDSLASSYAPGSCSSPSAPCNERDQQFVKTGMWVVKNRLTDSGDNNGSYRRRSYKYADGRTDRQSGSFLGFRQFTTLDLDNGETHSLEFYTGSINSNAQKPEIKDSFGFVFAGHPMRETVSIPGVAGVNHTTKNFEYEFAKFNGGLTGIVRPTHVLETISDPRQTGCSGAGASNSVDTTLNYVSTGPGALTGELLTEQVVKAAGATCQSVGRRNATETSTKSFAYHPDDAETWIVARIKDVSGKVAVVEANGEALSTSVVETSSTTEVDPIRGVVTKSINQPNGGPDQRSEIEYSYDPQTGLVMSTTTRAAGVPDRTTSTKYDRYGFPREVTNSLGHRMESIVDPVSGQVVWSRDMNGVISRKLMDGFFRELETQAPSGESTTLVTATSYDVGPSTLLPRQVLAQSQIRNGTGSVVVINHKTAAFDRLGREVFRSERTWNGGALVTQKTFDWRGRLIFQSVPAATVGGQGYVSYEYDELERVTSTVSADGRRTETVRGDLRTTVISPDLKVAESVTDSLGRVIETYARDGAEQIGKVSLSYRADGKLINSRDAAGNTTSITFDPLGRRLSLQDPDAGLTKTFYNGFGEVRLEVNSLGTTTTFTRDVLGRTIEQRVDELADKDRGRAARTRLTKYTWDAAPHGLGKLHTSLSYDGVAKAMGYDKLGRMSAESTVHNGREQLFVRTYDGAGRLDVLTYPEAKSPGQAVGAGVPTRVKYGYNGNNGSLAYISNADTGGAYWSAEDRDEQGHITQERFGNNVVTNRVWDLKRGWMTNLTTTSGTTILQDAEYAYSPAGMLKGRTDHQAPGGELNETFQYDALNRLRWWCVKDVANGSDECEQSQFGVGYTFTDNGNLTERRTFTNGAKTNPVETIAFSYPGVGTPQTHGVQQRQWVQGEGATGNFAYDLAGRQWQRPGQELTYNSNDLPEKIVAGTSTTTYVYADGGGRYQKKTVLGANLTRTTTYAGGLYELREESGTAATQARTHVYYISAGNTVLAQLTRTEPNLLGLQVEYLHNDHLGTVSFSTSGAGVVSNKVRTDPYGNRFDPSKAPRLDQPVVAGVANVTRGFTGHEMEVDDLGVINMGGRIFDPINARFNTPDPVVQSPQYGQSYNRYMYVMGNPLGFVDPTGYWTMYMGSGGTEQHKTLGTGSGSTHDRQVEESMQAMNAMVRQSMAEAQQAEEKRDQLVEKVKNVGKVSQGAAEAIVDAHAQRVSDGTASKEIAISGVQTQQIASTQGGGQSTSTAGLLAANDSVNSKTATDAGKGYESQTRSASDLFVKTGDHQASLSPSFQKAVQTQSGFALSGADLQNVRVHFRNDDGSRVLNGGRTEDSQNIYLGEPGRGEIGYEGVLHDLLHELGHVAQFSAIGKATMDDRQYLETNIYGTYGRYEYRDRIQAETSLSNHSWTLNGMTDTRWTLESQATRFGELMLKSRGDSF
jgi:RHS repeat-associated protein